MDGFNLEHLNSLGPLTFQLKLYELVREKKPEIVVETGVHNGVSTVCILAALQMNGSGVLYSCDTRWRYQGEALDHLRPLYPKTLDWEPWTFVPGKSVDALPRIKRDPWDLFVHDSDHRPHVMAWELEYAFSRLSESGVIVCDDWDAIESEGAFSLFVKKHDLSPELHSTAAIISLPSP